jgi:glycosyltransferase involved in cell wall biosynthesis
MSIPVIPPALRNLLRRVRSRLFQELENELRAEIGNLRSEIDKTANELGKLERLLTEHPNLHATSVGGISFPSPVVSIVMPTWNRGAVIGAAIRSVQAQQFPDWELIVVDDGSSDDTAQVVATFAADVRIRCVTQAHAGQCAARNNALKLAKGALIAYLDSDNLWYEGFLAAAVAVFAARRDVDCAYGAMITESHIPDQRILFEPFNWDRLLDGNYIGMSTFIHRHGLYKRHGGFDTELSTLEDWDLILRYTSDAPAYALPFLAVRYRVVDDKRVTVTQPQQETFAKVRRKWKPV